MMVMSMIQYLVCCLNWSQGVVRIVDLRLPVVEFRGVRSVQVSDDVSAGRGSTQASETRDAP